MKKIFCFTLGLLVLLGYSYSQSITINSPVQGEILQKGSIHNITWSGSGLTNLVKITLWQNGSLVGLIVKDQSKTGFYRWTVGEHIEGAVSGNNYNIKIREQGGAAFTTENSSGDFSIASLTLTSPNGGESWADGSTHNITWTSNGISGNVVVELIKVILKRPSSSTAKALYTGNVNSGSFSWTIDERLSPLATLRSKLLIRKEYKYLIRISSVNNSIIKDISNRVFKITPKLMRSLPRCSIQITYPDRDTVWNILSMNLTGAPKTNYKYTITWTKQGIFNPSQRYKATIVSQQSSGKSYMVRGVVNPSAGFFNGELSRKFPVGRYKFVFKTLDGELFAESEVFRIRSSIFPE